MVAAAVPGETITFQAGLGTITLADPLTIGAELSLVGPATIDMDDDATLRVTSAAQSKLDRITITGGEPAVHVDTGADLLVQRSSLAGIVFEDGSAGALGGLQDFGNTVLATGDAVLLGEDADVNVSHNTIVSETGDAIRLRSHQAQVFLNTLQGGAGDAGLELSACDDAQVITQNTIGGEGDGVDIAATGCQVGGTGEDDGNTITGAAGAGVVVRATGAGAQVLGNTIADNGGDGVGIEPGATARLRQNTIADNGGLGIDAGPDGPSGLRPTLTSATREEGGLRVRGTAPAAGGFTLEVFAGAACDPSGFGEGARNLGLVNVAVPAPGGAFDVLVPADTDVGTVATATLTGIDQATTEFSGCATITRRPRPRWARPRRPRPRRHHVRPEVGDQLAHRPAQGAALEGDQGHRRRRRARPRRGHPHRPALQGAHEEREAEAARVRPATLDRGQGHGDVEAEARAAPAARPLRDPQPRDRARRLRRAHARKRDGPPAHLNGPGAPNARLPAAAARVPIAPTTTDPPDLVDQPFPRRGAGHAVPPLSPVPAHRVGAHDQRRARRVPPLRPRAGPRPRRRRPLPHRRGPRALRARRASRRVGQAVRPGPALTLDSSLRLRASRRPAAPAR